VRGISGVPFWGDFRDRLNVSLPGLERQAAQVLGVEARMDSNPTEGKTKERTLEIFGVLKRKE
jgi:hypothetical protein